MNRIKRAIQSHKVLIALWVLITMAALVTVLAPSLSWLLNFGDNVVVPASFWSAIAFILYYTVLAPWWRTSVGRMIVSLDFAVMLTLLGPVLHIEFGIQFAQADTIRLTVAGLLIVTITIIARIYLVGKLHGWRPHRTWRHKGVPASIEDPVITSTSG